MGKREELIAAAARAISKTSGWPDDMWDDPEAYSTSKIAKEAYVAFATAALDEIIAGLKTPSEEMEREGVYAVTFCTPIREDAPTLGVEEARTVWQAMISTLEETKP